MEKQQTEMLLWICQHQKPQEVQKVPWRMTSVLFQNHQFLETTGREEQVMTAVWRYFFLCKHFEYNIKKKKIVFKIDRYNDWLVFNTDFSSISAISYSNNRKTNNEIKEMGSGSLPRHVYTYQKTTIIKIKHRYIM